jgi:hypothetical protein
MPQQDSGHSRAKADFLAFHEFFPGFAILHICAALEPHTDGTVNAKKKGSASYALTSLAGQTGYPRYGWRCSGY